MALRIALCFLVLSGFAFLAASCGDDDQQSPSDGSRLGDDDYLKVICSGTSAFSGALNTATKIDDLRQVIKDFVGSLQKVNPPSDLDQFHQQFIKYLQDANSDPTSLVTRRPPLPSDSVRQRLAARETKVAECRDISFFGRAVATPSP